jgi:hypothetical protein
MNPCLLSLDHVPSVRSGIPPVRVYVSGHRLSPIRLDMGTLHDVIG